MAKFTATTPQTLAAAGDPVVWQNDEIKGCCRIYHKPGTGVVELAGGTHCCPVRYQVSVHLNVRGVAGAIGIGIFQDGDELITARMNVVPETVGNVWSVDSTTVVSAECRCTKLTVRTITPGVTVVNGEINITPPTA